MRSRHKQLRRGSGAWCCTVSYGAAQICRPPRSIPWPCMATAWSACGGCMVSVWPLHGQRVAAAWSACGGCMVSGWRLHGQRVAAAWSAGGGCMVSVWRLHGQRVAAAWPLRCAEWPCSLLPMVAIWRQGPPGHCTGLPARASPVTLGAANEATGLLGAFTPRPVLGSADQLASQAPGWLARGTCAHGTLPSLGATAPGQARSTAPPRLWGAAAGP
jgi:hypothetical protein